MTEVRDVLGYEGIYVATSDGQVIRKAKGSGTQVGRVLKPYTNPYTGYQQYQLSKNAKVHTMSAQRIVAEAFHGPRPEGMDACT